MNILLVDEHALIRDALRGVLAELQSTAEILEGHDAESARRALEANCDIELIVFDLNLPDRAGKSGTRSRVEKYSVSARVRERGPYRAHPAAHCLDSTRRAPEIAPDDSVRVSELPDGSGCAIT